MALTPAQPHWPDSLRREDGTLAIDGVRLDSLADRFGTPLYVADVATVRHRALAYQSALRRFYPGASAVHYAAKAYLSTPMASLLASLGCGFDLSSFGEATIVRAAGCSLASSHLHGNAKSDDEIRLSLEAGVGSIAIDNRSEVGRVASIAADLGLPASTLVRVAPDIEAETHAHIMTGQRDSKFGVPLDDLDDVGAAIARSPSLELAGLHFHLGSQLGSPQAYARAIDVVSAAAASLRRHHGLETRVLSPGGGLGIAYTGGDELPSINEFIHAVATATVASAGVHGLDLPKLIVEPGRSIVGPAVVALYRVIGFKTLSTNRRIIHVDGGMGDNLRPALYGAALDAAVVGNGATRDTETVDIAGRFCESGDMICRGVRLPTPRVGDLVVVPAAGAYTVSMASNYNGALRPAVVAVDEGRAHVWQRRESYADLIARDVTTIRAGR